MVIKNKIIALLSDIDQPSTLNHILSYITDLNQKNVSSSGTRKSLRGSLSDNDAKTMMNVVDVEFSKIEGQW